MWRTCGAWEGSDFILRDVPFVSGGNHRILASFAVDANVLNICVDEGAVHATRPEMTRGSTPRRSPPYTTRYGDDTQTPGIFKGAERHRDDFNDGELTKPSPPPRSQCPGGPDRSLDLDAPSLEQAHPQCSRYLASAVTHLTPWAAAAHILIARFNGALAHARYNTRRVQATPARRVLWATSAT